MEQHSDKQILPIPPPLVPYGIVDEKSDLRLHVCPIVRRIYSYPTEAGVEAVKSGLFEERDVRKSGILTGRGFVVPPFDIRGCMAFEIPPHFIDAINLSEKHPPSLKAQHAETLVEWMFKDGRLMAALPLQTRLVTDLKEQFDGTDVIVSMPEVRCQIKMDFRAGEAERGGTGNLFLQIAERNIYGQH